MPPDKREHLFERFYRAHEGKLAIAGTGLGLNIVREIAEAQGGRAWAEHPEQGSIFLLALPLRRENEATGEHRAETDAPTLGRP